MAGEQTKLCPILSLGAMREVSRVVGAMGQPAIPQGEAMACQGSACALYIAVTGAQGQVVGGGCALAMIPAAMQAVAAATTERKA